MSLGIGYGLISVSGVYMDACQRDSCIINLILDVYCPGSVDWWLFTFANSA
ncbi:hypothetical protein PtrM4_028200 [Pyrenophora tritici-repentis]|uniref:Uncharacterized protein n=1 Tax=Pyrenophora tritici-repentis TaxID=45151 RepID=A0A834SA50_9PLEO|nr:hypothetical protein PtrM4_028200 [Pyrenophora tritici-repentis]KAI0575463.1 hypothetical protein Alg215_08013 [Pyrenophora tritici-repentis]